MTRTSVLRGFSAAWLLVAAASCQATQDSTRVNVDDAEQGETQVVDLAVDFDIIDFDDVGIPNFVVGQLGRVDIRPGFKVADIEAAMFPALTKVAPLFRLNPEELALSRAQTDSIGDHHFRFAQYKNGLQVIGSEIIVHVRDGIVTAVNGTARGDLAAPVEASVEVASAVLAAKQDSISVSDPTVESEPELAYLPKGEKLHLVYMVDVKGVRRDGLPVHDSVLVSAQDGVVLDRFAHIHTAKNRQVYNAFNQWTQPGTLARSEGQGPNSDPVVNTNYDLLGAVYDCYWNLFGRDSFDGAGAALISTVHYGQSYVNAYWDGTQMVYGDGDNVTASSLALSMDVTGHELTHAVTERTSGLIYSGESGGMNEALSDMFGNVCEWYRDGQVVSADTWIVGEDCWTPATPGDGLRYMNDPALDGTSADHYADYYSGMDVHYSSGIANLAFYLLSQGGTHPRGQSTTVVTGIGIAKAAQIFYHANAYILQPSSNFAAARTATVQAATNLGYSASEIDSVNKAWEAVGVGGGGGPDPTCAHDKCTAGVLLDESCSSCVAQICAVDPWCCSVNWDGLCIMESRTVCNSLKCAESNGTCSHSLCETSSSPLVSGCDSAQANCVAQICAVDSWCCSVTWDSICVSEVSSVCGKNCN